MNRRFVLFTFTLAFAFWGCQKKENLISSPDAQLNFSTDSILFDTVFANTGTTTRTLKIFNDHKGSINISSIKLAGGDNSDFKININGLPTNQLENYQIKAQDSAYVFIKAFINPNAADKPFLVEDSLIFTTNGNVQKIPLVAYAQNVIYLNNATISNNSTFTKEKPYVILNSLKVNKNAILNISAGARLYFHKGAQLLVDGTLNASGLYKDSITFASDRLERIYSDEPGQWMGLHFSNSSKNNILNYCVVKNAIVGIQSDSLSNNNQDKIILSNCIIKNHQLSALLAYNSSISSVNSLFFNGGKYLFAALNGGNYHFYQNTFAGYNYNFARNTPAVYLADNANGEIANHNLNAIFTNNIIWGSNFNELEFSHLGTQTFVTDFQKNLVKTSMTLTGNILNEDPLFNSPRKEDYTLMELSPALKQGQDLSSNMFSGILAKDLNGIARTYPSDLGCYQKP